MASEPTQNDMYLTVSKLNNNKYPGAEGICAGILRLWEDKMFKILNTLICFSWRRKQVPQHRIDAILCCCIDILFGNLSRGFICNIVNWLCFQSIEIEIPN